jgi:hypothetical protein
MDGKKDLNVTNAQAFKLQLCQRVEALPRVNQLEFIGLVANGDYVASSSDLWVFVHRHHITSQRQEQVMDLVKELNAEYELGFERALCQHCTPSFIDGHLQRWPYRLLKYLMEARLLRATVQKVAPSCGFVLSLHERSWKQESRRGGDL